MGFKIALGETAAKRHPEADLYVDQWLAEYGSDYLQRLNMTGELLSDPSDAELANRLDQVSGDEVEIITTLQGRYSASKFGFIVNRLRDRRMNVTVNLDTLPENIRASAHAPRIILNQAMDTAAPSVVPLRLFLCHCSGDKPIVRELDAYLRSLAIDVWFDERNLLPGQNWDTEVKKALATSDVVLICLSQKAADRIGYLQKEIRTALDYADEVPDDVLFIIPGRLEECDVPTKLRKWQWVDLFDPFGRIRLEQALTARAQDVRRRNSKNPEATR